MTLAENIRIAAALRLDNGLFIDGAFVGASDGGCFATRVKGAEAMAQYPQARKIWIAPRSPDGV